MFYLCIYYVFLFSADEADRSPQADDEPRSEDESRSRRRRLAESSHFSGAESDREKAQSGSEGAGSDDEKAESDEEKAESDLERARSGAESDVEEAESDRKRAESGSERVESDEEEGGVRLTRRRSPAVEKAESDSGDEAALSEKAESDKERAESDSEKEVESEEGKGAESDGDRSSDLARSDLDELRNDRMEMESINERHVDDSSLHLRSSKDTDRDSPSPVNPPGSRRARKRRSPFDDPQCDDSSKSESRFESDARPGSVRNDSLRTGGDADRKKIKLMDCFVRLDPNEVSSIGRKASTDSDRTADKKTIGQVLGKGDTRTEPTTDECGHVSAARVPTLPASVAREHGYCMPHYPADYNEDVSEDKLPKRESLFERMEDALRRAPLDISRI